MLKLGVVVAALALTAGAAHADTVVNVQLGDPANEAAMVMKADKTTAKAGKVVFEVTNASKTTVHEMIVVALSSAGQKLPMDAKTDTVEEKKIRDLGEAADLDPGTKKSLTLKLKPGKYVLICNQPSHYSHGMKVSFTVTP
jgi:uncharacterized cupredoxin-like copper-binding protein